MLLPTVHPCVLYQKAFITDAGHPPDINFQLMDVLHNYLIPHFDLTDKQGRKTIFTRAHC